GGRVSEPGQGMKATPSIPRSVAVGASQGRRGRPPCGHLVLSMFLSLCPIVTSTRTVRHTAGRSRPGETFGARPGDLDRVPGPETSKPPGFLREIEDSPWW